MPPALEYFFDVQCPFAYLASTQVRALAEATGAELIYKPVLLGGIYNALEDGGPYKRPPSPQRTRLTALDAHRWADLWGVELKFPGGHPVRSVLAMRCVLASGDIPRAAHALFDAAWTKGASIADRDVLIDALGTAGFSDPQGILQAAETQPVKDELRARTAEAVQRGAFGVPTFYVGDEMFWGQDRLDFVARALGAERHRVPSPDLGPPVHEVEAWFDFSSPFAYLGMTQIARVAQQAGARVVLKPFLLGGLFRDIGTPDVPMMAFSTAKRDYYSRELSRWAEHWKVPFKFTTRFPMRTILPLRATWALLRSADDSADTFVQAVFRALWHSDRDISSPEVLREICREAGVDPACVAAATEPGNKAALLQAGEQARERGLVGAPTFVVDGRLYWGQDRLDLVGLALRGFRPRTAAPPGPRQG